MKMNMKMCKPSFGAKLHLSILCASIIFLCGLGVVFLSLIDMHRSSEEIAKLEYFFQEEMDLDLDVYKYNANMMALQSSYHVSITWVLLASISFVSLYSMYVHNIVKMVDEHYTKTEPFDYHKIVPAVLV